MDLPNQASVVIVGGGIVGCSLAYHLTLRGCTDVVLLERKQLTCGTTWHAAGLMVTFGSTSGTSTELRQYTADLYSRLEAETGLATGFKPVGFVELAADNLLELELTEGVAMYDPQQAVALAPVGGPEFGYKGAALAGLAEREQQPMRHEDGVVDPFDVAVGHRGPLTVEHVAEIVQQLGFRLERMRQGADGAGTVGDSRRCHRSGV